MRGDFTMTIYNAGWELFSKTGDISFYLLYKSGIEETAGSEYKNGEYQDPGADNKKLGLR